MSQLVRIMDNVMVEEDIDSEIAACIVGSRGGDEECM